MSKSGSKERVAARAGHQAGRVKWSQLKELGVSDATIASWVARGYLHPRLPGVYAVGHPAGDYRAHLIEVLFYAGPGAMLSHATAAHWLGLLDDKPGELHVSTPRQCRCRPGVKVHARRVLERIWHDRLATTTIPQTLLDLAADEPLRIVRKVLANADFRRKLDIRAVNAVLGKGRPGSSKLRTALQDHQPRLALTKSELEVMFFELCEQAGIPLPEVNQRVAGWEVDVLWRDRQVAVELDGYDNHRSPAQVKRDRRKEMALRAAEYNPARYCQEQLTDQTQAVIADLRRLRGD